ncbi:MAG TPA: DUF2269 family protein [Candidatus Limnocylindrales bacterium]|nr:DUF2269 family protein [Candidatus Limnocylindrales bacterium]
MYQLFLYIHIICAVIWVGGAVAMQALAIMASRSSDTSDLPRVGHYAERIGTFVFLPASILLFIAGAVMVVQAWSFGQVWVAVSVGLWILSAGAGALYLGPNAKKVGQLFATEGSASTAGRSLLNRLFLVSRLELVSFFVIIALMVFKPGA